MPPTPMEDAFSTIIKTAYQYGTYRIGTYVLTLDDFTKLIIEQMPDLLKSLGIYPTQASSRDQMELIQATPRDQIEKLFNDFDDNGDKLISLDEFLRHMGNIFMEAYLRENVPKRGQDP